MDDADEAEDDADAESQEREDFALTITPLRSDRAAPVRRALTPGDPFAPRHTRRHHLLRTGAAWALVLAVSAEVLIRSLYPLLSLPAHRPLATALPPAQPHFAVERGRVFFTGWVPWGQLRIDAGPALALASQNVYPAPDGFQWPSFVLPPGRHTLAYAAMYFPTLTCTLSVPEAGGDTCPTVHLPVGSDGGAGQGPFPLRRVLLLPATPERLPADRSASLADVVQQALDAFAARTGPRTFATAAPGEPLQLLPGGQILRVAASLRAVPRYQLNRDPAPAAAATPVLVAPTSACVTLCTAEPQLSLYPDETAWPITANVAVSWAYQALDGQSAAAVAAVAGVPIANLPPLAHVRVDVAVWREEQSWQAQVLQPPFCQAALQQAGKLIPASDSPTGELPSALPEWAPLSFFPAADGCLLVGYFPDARGGTLDRHALLVYRFGVVLTANALASYLYPQLPQADAREQALAASLDPAETSPRPSP